MINKNQGFGLIEALAGAAFLAVTVLLWMNFFTQQTKAANYFEYQGKREEFRLAIIGQVLADSNNCKCMFAPSTPFPDAGVAQITGYPGSPAPITAIGKFQPRDCSGLPSPLLNAAGMDSVSLVSVNIVNVVKDVAKSGAWGNAYNAEFVAITRYAKDVNGPQELPIKIPVVVITDPPVAGNVTLKYCMNKGAPYPDEPNAYSTRCRGGAMSCDQQAIAICAARVGTPNYCVTDLYESYADAGGKNTGVKGYTCVPGICANLTTTTFTHPFGASNDCEGGGPSCGP